MRRRLALRALFVALLTFLIVPQAAHAQRTITLDNEGCSLGFRGLSKVLGVSLRPNRTPQKIGNRCRAEAVNIAHREVLVRIDRLEWATGGLTALANGKMPATFRLTLTGAHVTVTPDADPVWTMLAAQPQGMDAELLFGFSSSENTLTIHRAQVDFQNGSVVTLNANLGNVSPVVPEKPLLGVVSYLLNDLTLTVSNGISPTNPIWELVQNEVGDAVLQEVKVALNSVLSGSGQQAFQNLITDLPRPSGTTRLTVKSSVGYALLRLALVTQVKDLENALSDLEIHLSHGAASP